MDSAESDPAKHPLATLPERSRGLSPAQGCRHKAEEWKMMFRLLVHELPRKFRRAGDFDLRSVVGQIISGASTVQILAPQSEFRLSD